MIFIQPGSTRVKVQRSADHPSNRGVEGNLGLEGTVSELFSGSDGRLVALKVDWDDGQSCAIESHFVEVLA